ncbi:MAG: DUF4115 domain-containing protein [Candidatus Kapabacteria bacterium]|nr:DUF4115 domain-containing protein [Candidatus Kapabacteria bacterium]
MDKPYLPFKEFRQNLNLTIENVSDRTKIRSHILLALEDNDFSFLPPVYMIGFLKTYAQFLKIPENLINDAIEYIKKTGKKEELPVYSSNPTYIDDSKKSGQLTESIKLLNKNQSVLVNYLIYSAIGLALIALIYFTFFSSGTNDNLVNDKLKTPDTAVIGNTNRINLPKIFEGDSLVLEARCIEKTWLRIIIDGKSSEELDMLPEMTKRWSAAEYFILTIGNEGGVIFTKDGQQLPPFGTKGSVIRNVRITREKVDVSSSPWSVLGDTSLKKRLKKNEEKPEPVPLLEPSPVIPSFKSLEEEQKKKKPN